MSIWVDYQNSGKIPEFLFIHPCPFSSLVSALLLFFALSRYRQPAIPSCLGVDSIRRCLIVTGWETRILVALRYIIPCYPFPT